MSLTKTLDSSYYEAFLQKFFIIEICGDRIAFTNAHAASEAFCALAKGRKLDYMYSGFSGVNYKLSKKDLDLTQSVGTVLDGDPEELNTVGRKYELRCDHNKIEKRGVCGISSCYHSTSFHKDDPVTAGWFCFNPEDFTDFGGYDLENEEPELHCCCPECAASIASDLEIPVEELTRSQVWEGRQFELTFIEKKKEEEAND